MERDKNNVYNGCLMSCIIVFSDVAQVKVEFYDDYFTQQYVLCLDIILQATEGHILMIVIMMMTVLRIKITCVATLKVFMKFDDVRIL